MPDTPLAAVIGALNIDLVIQGLPHFAKPGEQVNGRSVRLSPGGKGRNIAAMLVPWLGGSQVSMIGKLVQDAHGLFHIPLDSLSQAGVDTGSVLVEIDRPQDLPTLSIFLNQQNGLRASYYLPGRNESLTPVELDPSLPLLEQLAANRGILVVTLEMPIETAAHALKLADDLGLCVMLDPGGQPPESVIDFSPLFKHPSQWIKPNVQEAKRLTGISVTDFDSAAQAAERFLEWGIEKVLITDGAKGAYGFTEKDSFRIPVPKFDIPPHAESTGCGDQVLAVLCAETLHGKPFREAAQKAVVAGTIQFIQQGSCPVPPDHPLFDNFTN
jgi:ribokinase